MPPWVRGWGCEGEFNIPALEGRPGAGAWLPGPTPRDCGSVSLPRSVVGIPTREALVQLQPRQHYTIYVRALSVGGPSARSDPVTVYTTGMCPGHTLPGTSGSHSAADQHCMTSLENGPSQAGEGLRGDQGPVVPFYRQRD